MNILIFGIISSVVLFFIMMELLFIKFMKEVNDELKEKNNITFTEEKYKRYIVFNKKISASISIVFIFIYNLFLLSIKEYGFTIHMKLFCFIILCGFFILISCIIIQLLYMIIGYLLKMLMKLNTYISYKYCIDEEVREKIKKSKKKRGEK